jgi:hypothetical protein
MKIQLQKKLTIEINKEAEEIEHKLAKKFRKLLEP